MSNEKKKFNWKAVTQHHLFLPIVCLLVVLLVNVIKTPDFFVISMKGGVLYGYLVDVVNRASELVIVAIGMTLVTAASGGQDISVGGGFGMLPDIIRRTGVDRYADELHGISHYCSNHCCRSLRSI